MNTISSLVSIPILILSGQNNHDWQKTTPALEKIFSESGRFTVTVTNRPDTLKYADYKKFSLVVSNWNSWPDTSTGWDQSKERAFTRYVREGGGALFLHAGGSSFYSWPEYHAMSIGRWGAKTSHGAIGQARVIITDKKHPVTKGLSDFSITDEIWENTDIHPSTNALATVRKLSPDGTTEPGEYPAILVSRFGRGRTFYTILGHDEKTLANPDLQKLLINAAGWAAHKGK